MTLSELRTTLQGRLTPQKTLEVKAVDLGGTAAITLTTVAGASTLNFTEASISPSGSPLLVRGKLTLWGVQSAFFKLEIIEQNNALAFTLYPEAVPGAWEFSAGFAQTANSFFDKLALTNVQLVATSYAHTNAAPAFALVVGLNFFASTSAAGSLQRLSEIGVGATAFDVQGTIAPQGSAFAINLEYTIASDLKLDLLGFQSVTLQAQAKLALKSTPQAGGAFENVANITGTARTTQFTFPARLNVPVAETAIAWELRLNSATLDATKISDVLALSTGENVATFFPTNFSALNDLQISALDIDFLPLAPQSASLATQIALKPGPGGVPRSWEILSSPRLAVGDFAFTFALAYYADLFNTRSLGVKNILAGKINIGTAADLKISVMIPLAGDWELAILPENVKLPTLSDFAQFLWPNDNTRSQNDFIKALPGGLVKTDNASPAIALSEIKVGFNPSPPALSYVAFGLAQQGSWGLAAIGLEISGWSLALRVDAKQSNALTGLLHGFLKIGTVANIEATLPIPAGNAGWVLRLKPGTTITFPSIGELFTMIGGAGSANGLPQGLATFGKFQVDQLEVNFNPQPASLNSFKFNMQGLAPWTIITNYLALKNIHANLALTKNNLGKYDTVGSFGGIVEVFHHDIWITAGREAATQPWRLQIALQQAFHIPGLADLAQWMSPGEMLQYLPKSFIPFGSGFDLTALNLDFDITSSQLDTIGFTIQNSEPWEVVRQYFVLDKTSVSAMITKPGQANQSSAVHIQGSFIFDKYEVRVTANKAKADLNNVASAGWDFTGKTYGQAIPLGKLITHLGQKFGAFAPPKSIENLTVENLGVTFNTASKEFTFTCEARFPVGDKIADLTVFLDLKSSNGVYSKTFRGLLQIGAQQFAVNFKQDAAATIFIAAYSHPANQPQTIKVKDLVANISSTLANDIPSTLEIDLKDVLLALDKSASTKFLFGLDIGASVNLSNLPLVGKEFPSDQTVGVEDLQVLYASQNFSESEVAAFNQLLPQDVTPLPIIPPQTTGNTLPPVDPQRIVLASGLNVSAKLKLGNTPMPLSLPMSTAPPANTGTNTTPTAAAPPDNTKWFTIQKAFGPVHFERVGVQYQNEKLWFLLDAGLSVAALTLTLDGLAVGSALKKFSPEFNLRGLGLDYKSGPLEIGGAFLRQTVTTPPPPYEQYSGAALIKTELLTLSAIGSYAKVNGYYSLFLYAVLDYPLGGPAFFFVTGLAAGFGYNRGLQVPPIDKVAQFPLVSEAVNGTSGPKNLEAELRSLQTYIPPAPGANFLAVGLKFTSFKMIDSFALLTVLFGDHFEIDVLGLSTLIVPTPEAAQVVTPLAEVQMALRASFIPAQGFLSMSAQLTTASYLFSRACHLTGGFAFYSWFAGEHAGDFALTLGGYHPLYKVPAHYPQVPRVGFNWKIDDNLSLKGEAYYALTASALMAGGLLQALWQSDNIQASFNANANFIIAWKPYFYDANIGVDIAVAVTIHFFGTHHITADVGADLHLWGPDFAGDARIHLWIVSFTIHFGASNAQLKAIDWPTFQNSFLPKDEAVCGIAVQNGLVRKVGEDKIDLGVINAKTLLLVTNSAIPAKEAYQGDNKIGDQYAAFGVAPMDVKTGEVTTARHTITIKRAGISVEDKFAFEPIYKNLPVGMWGQNFKPDINAAQFVSNALAGFKITPKRQPAAGMTHPIARKVLEAELEPVDEVYSWGSFAAFTPQVLDPNEIIDARKRREAMRASLTNAATARAQILTALGVSSAVNISPAAADVFVIAPQIEK